MTLSKNDRRAVLFIMFIQSFIEEGYLRIYADTLLPVVRKLAKLYYKTVDEKTYDTITYSALKAKEEILQKELKSTSLMMLAFVIFVADTFLMYVKGERKELWQELKDKTVQQTIRKEAGKTFKKSYGNEYDKANILIDIIWENAK